MSSSTWTFEALKLTNDAAFPLGLGLSAEANVPRYSFSSSMCDGLSFEGKYRPRDRSSSSRMRADILLTETGSGGINISKVKFCKTLFQRACLGFIQTLLYVVGR